MANFPLDSLARPTRANGTRPRVRLRLKKSAAPTGGLLTARRRDPTRRRALPPRRAAPQPRTLRALQLELLADGRLQRACFTGVFVRRPAASAGGLPASPWSAPRPLGRRVLEHIHHGFANYPFGNDSGDISPHSGLELFDRC